MATDREVFLTTNQRLELSSIAQSRSLPAGYVFRAKLILLLAEGACFSFTSPRPIPRGSTKSRSGSPRSNARSLRAAFSLPCRIWLASSVATSTPTPPMSARFSGNTTIHPAAYALTNSLRQSTSCSGGLRFLILNASGGAAAASEVRTGA